MKSAQQALFAYFAMLRNICLEIVLQVIGDNATGLLGNIMVLSIIFRLKIHICHNMLVIECFDTNIFLSFYLFFLILYFFSFEFLFLLVTRKRHVTSQSHNMSHGVTSQA